MYLLKLFTIALLVFFTSILFYFCHKPRKNNQDLPQTTKVLIDQLKIRMGPNTSTAEIGKLNINDEVAIIRRSEKAIQIGSLKAHWYNIITKKGEKGWVYGAYLGVEGKPIQSIQSKQEEFEKMITGRWYATKTSGQITQVFVTFYDDKKVELGIGTDIKQEGIYHLESKENYGQVLLANIENPLITNFQLELRGQTFILKGNYKGTEYTFQLTEKSPKSLEFNKTENSPKSMELNQ